MLGSRSGFLKGFIAGSILGGAACMMVEPPDAAMMRRMKKKANRAIKKMEYALENLIK